MPGSHIHISTCYFASYEALLSQTGRSAECVLFVDCPGKAGALSMCQLVFGSLPFTLNLTHSPLVGAMSILSSPLECQLDVQLHPGY